MRRYPAFGDHTHYGPAAARPCVRSPPHASNTYGVFALVIGLLAWLHVGAQMTVYAAAINVVLVRHLWQRRLLDPPAEP